VRIDIVTPKGSILDTSATVVTVPSVLGEMGLMPGHLPIIAALQPGRLTVESAEGDHVFAVDRGFVEMARDHINVITEAALKPDEIDIAQVKADRDAAIAAAKSEEGNATAQESRLLAERRAEALLAVAESAQS
jgi:F-type H+-transporting ATPase subunit epsilon